MVRACISQGSPKKQNQYRMPIYLYIYRERQRQRQRERGIYFMELCHAIMWAGMSEICRAG